MRSIDVKHIYSDRYYREQVDGCLCFDSFDGSFQSLFERYQKNVQILGLQPNHRFLDVGCGRGEICIYHACQGGESVGIDFSEEAITIALEKSSCCKIPPLFLAGPFQVMQEFGGFDRILASEFIEHISPEEGNEFMHLAWKALKPQGKLLIYTYPNTLQRRFGYSMLRLHGRIVGFPLPSEQADTLSPHYREYHLNEQNFISLRSLAKRAGFAKYRVTYDMPEYCSLLGKLVEVSPLHHLFDTNLVLVAEK